MDWPAMMEAAGRMGMSEIDFELTTPRYFYHRRKGFERLQEEAWARTRMEAFYSFLPHTKKNALRRPQDLFKLPGDEFDFNYSDAEKAAMLDHLKKVKNIDLFAGETIPTA